MAYAQRPGSRLAMAMEMEMESLWSQTAAGSAHAITITSVQDHNNAVYDGMIGWASRK